MASGRTIRAFQISIVEHFHSVERKHAQNVRSFHAAQRFHGKAAGIKAARVVNRAYATVPGCDADA